ncbi:MAG: hypothetical protein Q7T55_10985, partial [Solirubrobacteraceae bacterium]|nr:hypothetical protein [Solirubrobacteraceae bacterium]
MNEAVAEPRVWPVGPRALAGLGLVAVLAWLILPTAPNYDTASHLVWSHELLAGRAPDVEYAASPTMHPLWLVAALIAALTGGGASLLQLVTLLSLMMVVACAYRLAADVAGRIAGIVAAVASGSSFALLLLAFKAYVDMPFLAVVLTAVVVERAWSAATRVEPAGGSAGLGGAERRNSPPREGVIRRSAAGEPAGLTRRTSELNMPLLMLVAGLLRPEAWAIGLLFVGLRLVRGAAARSLVVPALIVLAAPVIWALFDFALTGDPMHSLTGTQALAEELGRKTGLANAPKELIVQLSDLARPPIAAAGVLGVVLALQLAGLRRLLIPIITLGASAVGFLLVGALGLPLLQRYLQLPAILLCVFAGIATAVIVAAARGRRLAYGGAQAESVRGNEVAGPDPASPAPSSGVPSAALRVLATSALIVGVVGAVGYLALKADSFRIVGQGVLNEADWQRDGARLLDDPAVVRAARCGPTTLPTYRFIPELTLRADRDAG